MHPFCPECEPSKRLTIDPKNPTHYSVEKGDSRRIAMVKICGEDVTRRCRACIAGVEGYVELFIEPKQKCSCYRGLLMQVLHGNVEVTANPLTARPMRSQEGE